MFRSVFEPLERRVLCADTILFVRGGHASGGFLDATDAAARNLQLADIADTSTADRNTGWGTLAQTLRDNGFAVEQFNEAKGLPGPFDGFYQGKPIRFDTLDLTQYAALVFGSNNAAYPRYVVNAVEAYVRGGGGALFISDANFGSDWRDAPSSDQPFLSRFGLTVQQDTGATTVLTRGAGDFVVPEHPVLAGVDAFSGEGMSPFVVPDVPPPDTTIQRIVAAKGNTRNNDGTDPAARFAGTIRPTDANDASLVLITAGVGRVAAFFDRNTFFNANGRGTDITEHDNQRLAINLFEWVTDRTPPAVAGWSFRPNGPSELRVNFTDHLLAGSLTREDVFMRNGVTGEPIPNARWWFQLEPAATGVRTDLVVFIKGAQPAGQYWLQINPFRIRDDSGNPNRKRLRAYFTIAPPLPLHPPPTVGATVRAAEPPSQTRLFDALFGEEPVVPS